MDSTKINNVEHYVYLGQYFRQCTELKNPRRYGYSIQINRQDIRINQLGMGTSKQWIKAKYKKRIRN